MKGPALQWYHLPGHKDLGQHVLIFSFTTISNKFLMQEEGINLKIKLTFSICFIEKVCHFIPFGKVNLPIGSKIQITGILILCQVNFCRVGLRKRPTQYLLHMQAQVRLIIMTCKRDTAKKIQVSLQTGALCRRC